MKGRKPHHQRRTTTTTITLAHHGIPYSAQPLHKSQLHPHLCKFCMTFAQREFLQVETNVEKRRANQTNENADPFCGFVAYFGAEEVVGIGWVGGGEGTGELVTAG